VNWVQVVEIMVTSFGRSSHAITQSWIDWTLQKSKITQLTQANQELTQSRDEIIKEQLERAIGEGITALPYMKEVFKNPTYELNKIVENELDFLLGAVFSSILDRNAMFLLERLVKPTNEEFIWINHFLFSRADQLKDLIRKILEV